MRAGANQGRLRQGEASGAAVTACPLAQPCLGVCQGYGIYSFRRSDNASATEHAFYERSFPKTTSEEALAELASTHPIGTVRACYFDPDNVDDMWCVLALRGSLACVVPGSQLLRLTSSALVPRMDGGKDVSTVRTCTISALSELLLVLLPSPCLVSRSPAEDQVTILLSLPLSLILVCVVAACVAYKVVRESLCLLP